MDNRFFEDLQKVYEIGVRNNKICVDDEAAHLTYVLMEAAMVGEKSLYITKDYQNRAKEICKTNPNFKYKNDGKYFVLYGWAEENSK